MFALIAGLLFIPICFASVIEAPAVPVDFAQNPSQLNWKKIDSEHFEIIFPQEVEAGAQRVTHLLEAVYPVVTRSLEVKPQKISLILQNQSTTSNGFVTLAPRRSEWFLTPAIDPEMSNTEWLKTLSIHEFRHVVQFQKTRQRVNWFFEIILGEIGQALGLGLSLPPWFLEGDAVGIETALTKGGRGRLPLFERDLKAILLSGKDYDYDKTHLGSYKDYIPNHYLYGYFYTTFMRNKHGDLFLSKVADESTTSSYNPLSFYNSYTRLTGINFDEFYRQTMKELIQDWKEKEAKLKLTPYEVQNIRRDSDWVNYLYPQQVSKGFLALKKGLSYIEQFILTDGKYEETVLYPGPLQAEYPYKVRDNKFAFVELEIDPRWGYRDYSRIRVFDLEKRKFVADFRKTKGRLAVLDHRGERVIYVNWDEKQGQDLMIRNLDGKVLKRLTFPVQRVITSLDWLSDDEIVMVVKNHHDHKQVLKLSLSSLTETELIPESALNLGFVSATADGQILIESPSSGIDNIFAITDSGLKQLTSSRFGAYSPSLSNNTLIYSEYTADGMNIVSKKLPWNEEQTSSDSFVPYYTKLAIYENSGERNSLDKDFFNQDHYPVTNYSQFKNSLNLHSWIILAPPLTSTLTFMGLSRDLLNKFSLSFGANYDLNEKETEGFVSAAWSHLYPVLDMRAAYGGRNQTVNVAGKEVNDHWEEGTFETGMQLPWQKLTGRFTHTLNLRGFAKVIKVTNKRGSDLSEINHGALFSPGAELQFNSTSRLAYRDLNPLWGVSLLTHFEEGKDITGTDQNGALFTQDTRFYLPGLFKHHSFFNQLAYERQRDSFYQYASLLSKPRGTGNIFLEEQFKFSGNYLFPLFYPDWHLSRYAYFKRISMNLFYDEVNGYYSVGDYYAASTGWELLFDINFFRIFIPINIGVRGNYILHGKESNNYEIFITTLGGVF